LAELNPLDKLLAAQASATMTPLDALLAGGSWGGAAPSEGYSPLGFVKNIGTGLANIAGGLTDLGSAIISDVGKGVAEAATLGNIETGGYATAAIGRALVGWGDQPSALLQDYA